MVHVLGVFLRRVLIEEVRHDFAGHVAPIDDEPRLVFGAGATADAVMAIPLVHRQDGFGFGEVAHKSITAPRRELLCP